MRASSIGPFDPSFHLRPELPGERIAGTGPTGISEENLFGVYKRTEGFDFLLLGPGGELATIGEDIGRVYEAGTYVQDGTELIVTPVIDSQGPPDPPSTVTASASASTLTIVAKGEAEIFTRCPFSEGASLQGAWFRVDGNVVTGILFMGASEYASMDLISPISPAQARELLSGWIRADD